MKILLLVTLLVLLHTVAAGASAPAPALAGWAADTLGPAPLPQPAPRPATKKAGLYDRVVSYLSDANKPKPDPRDFDIGVIGGPYYSQEVKVAIGIVASGQYCAAGDTLVPPSHVALGAEVSTIGFVQLSAEGAHLFPGDRWRFIYDATFYYLPTHYWGIGYEAGAADRYTKIRDASFKARADFMLRIGPNLFLGPCLDFHTTKVHGITDREIWAGQPERVTAWGPAAKVEMDTRDNHTFPRRGFHATLCQYFYPRCLGNGDWNHSVTELTATAYQKTWRGAVVAERVHCRWAYGHVAWSAMSVVGTNRDLRGYYEGQYCDKLELDAIVELRQHVWRRSSAVVWAGVGAVAPYMSALRSRQLLPNFGLGYRWEFKRNSNVRIDFGVGRHTSGVAFSINEAF